MQPSVHGTFQKVDFALLDSETRTARVMVEAKRFSKTVSAELIEKYLEPGLRGAVTNGRHWVLCADGKSKLVPLCRGDGAFVEQALDEVVSFLRGEHPDVSSWNGEDANAEQHSQSCAPKSSVRAKPASTSAGPFPSDAGEQRKAGMPKKPILTVVLRASVKRYRRWHRLRRSKRRFYRLCRPTSLPLDRLCSIWKSR
ncbi:hypothetical protein SAMN05414139_02930 [Burkholderia sp. D7]|nr:hypothetical protein SAMN05414139_02930 [Burkholderia sp. D7]